MKTDAQFKKMNKLTIFIDMDGVVADFDKAAREHPDFGKKGFRPDLTLDFAKFEPIEGAIESVNELVKEGHDVLFASTAPWDYPESWAQKRIWIAKHFPKMRKKLIITARKDLLAGDILIDDHAWNGAKDFTGQWFQFGKDGMDWKYIIETIKSIMSVNKVWIKEDSLSKKSDFLPHNLKYKK